MADHLRQQARAAAKAIILAASTTAGDRVYTGRTRPLLADGPWPQVTISSQGERGFGTTMGGGFGQRVYARTYRLNIVVHAKDATDVEAVLDAAGKQIEIAIAGNLTLSGTAKYCSLAGTLTELSDDSDQPAGALTMAYDVEQYSRESTPDVLS